MATWDAWPKISDDVFYVTVDANVNVKRPFVQPYSDAVYIDFDALRRDTSQSNFSAAINDLTMLWADIRQACNPSDPLLLVLQNGDKATAVTIENNMAAQFVRSVQAAKSSTEVVVPKTDSLVGAGVSLDRLGRLLHKRHYKKCRWGFVASVKPFRVVVCRHVATVAGSVLETSVHIQVSVFPVGTLVPLPTLWHFNGAGIAFYKGPVRQRLALRGSSGSGAGTTLAPTPTR